MNVTEKRARQLIEKLGLDWDNEIEDININVWDAFGSHFVSVSMLVNSEYLDVTFRNYNVEICPINDYPILDTILSFGWEGELTFQERIVTQRTINMTSK